MHGFSLVSLCNCRSAVLAINAARGMTPKFVGVDLHIVASPTATQAAGRVGSGGVS
jgi:hypothetical protein